MLPLAISLSIIRLYPWISTPSSVSSVFGSISGVLIGLLGFDFTLNKDGSYKGLGGILSVFVRGVRWFCRVVCLFWCILAYNRVCFFVQIPSDLQLRRSYSRTRSAEFGSLAILWLAEVLRYLARKACLGVPAPRFRLFTLANL